MYKISRFHIYLMIILALLIHLTVLNRIRVFGSAPDLGLVLVIFFGLFLGEGAGLESGLVSGFLRDIFALDYFGINTCLMGIVGLMAGLLANKFAKDTRVTQLTLVFYFTMLSMMTHFAVFASFSRMVNLGFIEYLTSSAVPSSIYTSVVSVPIISRLVAIYGLKESEEFI